MYIYSSKGKSRKEGDEPVTQANKHLQTEEYGVLSSECKERVCVRRVQWLYA